MRGLQQQGHIQESRPSPLPGGTTGDDWLANPALPEDILREAVSGQFCQTWAAICLMELDQCAPWLPMAISADIEAVPQLSRQPCGCSARAQLQHETHQDVNCWLAVE